MNQEDAAIFTSMEKNMGRTCSFTLDDGTVMQGVVSGIPNTQHYTVAVPRGEYQWPWYVRTEAIRFQDTV